MIISCFVPTLHSEVEVDIQLGVNLSEFFRIPKRLIVCQCGRVNDHLVETHPRVERVIGVETHHPTDEEIVQHVEALLEEVRWFWVTGHLYAHPGCKKTLRAKLERRLRRVGLVPTGDDDSEEEIRDAYEEEYV